LTAVPNGSVLVRVLPLAGGKSPRYAVLVERFRIRASLRAVASRYALSKREHEALALVVKGAKNSEIASRLQIAPSTAVFHVKRLMAKTGARNRAELVAKVVG
jgi:DNA-binding CsgD family transcriptional regulator